MIFDLKVIIVQNKNEYVRFKNKLTKVIRIAKYKYYDNEFKCGNVRKTWDRINKLIKPNTSKSRDIPVLLDNNNEITDHQHISNVFNSYFVNIGPSLSTGITSSDAPAFYDYLPSANECNFFFIPTDSHEVFQCIKNLKSCSPGIDSIHPKVVKVVAPLICSPLSYIINLIRRQVSKNYLRKLYPYDSIISIWPVLITLVICKGGDFGQK